MIGRTGGARRNGSWAAIFDEVGKRVAAVAIVGLALMPLAPASAAADPAGTAAPAPHAVSDSVRVAPPLLTRADAWFGLGAAAAVTAAGFADRTVWEHTHAQGSQDLADAVQPLGTPMVLGAAVIAGYGAGRLLGHPALAAASVRGAVALAAAGTTTLVLKYVVGRKRPIDSPGEPFEFDPFTGDASFPSGHTTLAFAAATVLDRETASRWVPWVAYPVAGLVGWSRLYDDEHWLSDVVAGAAVGFWVAGKTEDYMRRREGAGPSIGLEFAPSGAPALAARIRF